MPGLIGHLNPKGVTITVAPFFMPFLRNADAV